MPHGHRHHHGPGRALRHGLRELERDARHAAHHAHHATRHGHLTTAEEVGIGVLAGAALGAGAMAAASSSSSSRSSAPRGDSSYMGGTTTVIPAGGSGYYGTQPVGSAAYMGATTGPTAEQRQAALLAQQQAEEARVREQQAQLARQQQELAEERRRFEAKQKELALQKEREDLEKQRREFEEMQLKMAVEQSRKEAEEAEKAKKAAEAAEVAEVAAVAASAAVVAAESTGALSDTSGYYGGSQPGATQSTITSTADVAASSGSMFSNPYYSGASHPSSGDVTGSTSAATAPAAAPSGSFVGYPSLGKPAGPAPVAPTGPVLARAPASDFQPRADCRGTMKAELPYSPAKAMEDALDLRRAMKGLGSDKRAIVRITGTRSLNQRLMIKEAYKRVDGEGKKERSLLKDFNSELSGNFKKTVLLCYANPGSPDAKWLKEAMDGRGYDTQLLTEILCTRTNGELKAAIEAWTTVNGPGKSLKKRLSEETKKLFSSGNFHEFCTAILDLKRPMLNHVGGAAAASSAMSVASGVGGSVDRVKAKADAEMLNRKVSGPKADAKAAFVEVFTTRPWQQIAAISEEFQAISKKRTLDSSIHKFFGDSDTAVGLRSVLKFSTAPYAFWAERLQKSMKGLGTDDCELRRIIVSRCEIDLANISEEFAAHYGKGKTLKSWINDDTSGEYGSLLKLLCGFD